MVKGVYESPYSEYNFKFDWQILLATTQNNQRPTLPSYCPKEFSELVASCLDPEPDNRPTSSELVEKIRAIRHIYEEHHQEWDKCIQSEENSSSESNLKESKSDIITEVNDEPSSDVSSSSGEIQDLVEHSDSGSSKNNSMKGYQIKTAESEDQKISGD